MRSYNIHILVLHSGNCHMQKSPSCYLRPNTWKRKKSYRDCGNKGK